MHEDIYGRLWIGTAGGGLSCLQNRNWKTFTTTDGLSNDHIRTIVSDWSGQIWIGTDYGLNRYVSNVFTSYTNQDGLNDNVITSLAIDSRGYLWIGTLRGGLTQFQDRVVRVYGYQQGLKEQAVLAVLADRLDNIWIGTLHGLYFMDRGNGQIQFIRGTAYTPITSIVEDSSGTIWVATMADGLKRLAQGKFANTISPDGFPAAHHHDARDRVVPVVTGADVRLDIGAREDALVARNVQRLRACEHRGAATLRGEDVGLG